MTSASRAYVGLLGPLLVVRQESTELVRGPKQRIALSALCLNPGKRCGVSELIDRMWQDDPPPTASSALRVHIQHLRGLLSTGHGNPIPYVNSGYAIEPHLVQTDLGELSRLTDSAMRCSDHEARLGDVESALALWRGEPFVDLLSDIEFNIAANRLDEIRKTLAEDRAELLLELGRHAEAVSELATLVEMEPLRERRTQLLMLALYRSGRQADALNAYQSLLRRLRDDLGIDPGQESRQLHTDILRHSARLQAAASAMSAAPRAASTGPTPNAAMRVMTAQRLASLSDEVAALIRMVAVLDDLASPTLLASALGWTRPRFEAALKAARQAGLTDTGGSVPQLTTEIREGILSGLGLAELADLNSRAGHALLSQRPTAELRTRAAWHLIAGEAESELAGQTVVDAMQRLLAAGNLDPLRMLGHRATTLTSGAVRRQYWPAILAMLTEAGDAHGPHSAHISGTSTEIESRTAAAQGRVILLRHSHDVAARQAAAAELERLAQESSDPYWRFAPVMNDIFEAGRAGDLNELEVLCDQMAGIVEHAPSGRLRWLHLLTVSVLQLDRGNLAAAQAAMEHAAREGTAAGVLDAVHVQAFQQCVTAFHYTSIGPFVGYFEEVLAATPGLSFGRAVLALGYAQLDQRRQAFVEAERAWQQLRDDPTDEYWPFTMSVLAEALGHFPPDDEASELPMEIIGYLNDNLTPFIGQFITAGSILAAAGPARRYLGLLAWLQGDAQAAERLLRLAAKEATDNKMPLWRLRAAADLVRLLRHQGRADEARALAGQLRPEALTRRLSPCVAVFDSALD